MIEVTAKAAEKLRGKLAEKGMPNYGIRLGIQQSSCGCGSGGNFTYYLCPEEEPQPNDLVVKAGDVKLFVSSEAQKLLEGKRIDFADNLEEGFKITNGEHVHLQEHDHAGQSCCSDGDCGCQGNCVCGDDCQCRKS